MLRLRLVVICTLLIFLISGCAEKGSETEPETERKNAATVMDSLSDERPESETNNEINLVTKDEYLNALYGYYECGTYYYFIAEDTYEKKNKTDGTLENSGMLIDIEVTMQDDGVSFVLIFFRDSQPRVTMFCSSKGVISDMEGNVYQEITKETYDSVEPVKEEEKEVEDYVPETSQPEDPYNPWYVQNFDLFTVTFDLRAIDNFLAVGKEQEALQAFQTYVLDKLDRRVKELIQSREYWAAFNYVAMCDGYVSDANVSTDYKFLEDFLEETNPPSSAITAMGGVNFSTYLQKYYREILQARKTDTNQMDETACLYKMNEFFLQNGMQTVAGLWPDRYNMMYHTTLLDQNHNVTDYFIICPYTGQIRHLPQGFYFSNYAHFNVHDFKDVL